MINYATVEDFAQIKDLGTKLGSGAPTQVSRDKIEVYLARATRLIYHMTGNRDFLPRYETRIFPHPYAYIDLAIRRLSNGHLKLDDDLLELITLSVGSTVLDTDDYFLLEHNVYPKHTIAPATSGAWGGVVNARYNKGTISVTGIWGYADQHYAMMNECWVNTNETVPGGNLTSGATTISVTDADGYDGRGATKFLKGKLLRIDNEFLEVTDVDTITNTLTVLRGVRGSTAAAHTAGVMTKSWHVADDIIESTLQIAKTFREQDVSAGNRVAVSDRASDAEGIPMDAMNIIKTYRKSIL